MILMPGDWQDVASLLMVIAAAGYLVRRLGGMMTRGARRDPDANGASVGSCGGCAGCGLRKQSGGPTTLAHLGPPGGE
jgi:hypothetical protein